MHIERVGHKVCSSETVKMAGVVPSRTKSGRKQWTLHDGPRGSLNRLRNQLANDGCPESQVMLAKQLFAEECELEIDRKDNARLGVYWLIKASQQGNVEATELLRKCLISGLGITEHNFLDVKSCINMTQDEKIVRRAAREVFASLSNGEDFITSEQLQRRMLQIQNDPQKSTKTPIKQQVSEDRTLNNMDLVFEACDGRSQVNWETRNDVDNEKLTENQLISAAINFSHGELPVFNQILSLNSPNVKSLDHISYLNRSILHPIATVWILYHKMIKYFSQKTLRMSRDDSALFLIVAYLFFTSKNSYILVPTCLYYASFFVMVVQSFKILQNDRNHKDFTVWTKLFLSYSDGDLNSSVPQNQFVRNNLSVYLKFFGGLLLNLLVFTVISDQWLPNCEITILAFMFTFATLASFMLGKPRCAPKLLMLCSFGLNVIAKYPYDIDPVVTQGWRFLDLKIPSYVSHVIGNGIEICINFHLGFYVLIPVVLLCIARKDNWKGTYKYLIPHCVTLGWLQIVVINSRGIPMFCLLRSTLALVGVVLFLPLCGVVTVLLPAIAALSCVFTKSVIVNIAIYVLVVLAYWSLTKFLLQRTKYTKYVNLVQVTLGVVAIFVLLRPMYSLGTNTASYNPKISLSWEKYQDFCHQASWDASNVAKTQIECQKLVGNHVHWTGYVNDVKLGRITNYWSDVSSFLPAFVREAVVCYFGDENLEVCSRNAENSDVNDCEMFSETTKRCTLHRFNAYQLEISVRMQSGIWGKSAELILLAEHAFLNFTTQLKPNDKVWFSGKLVNNVGLGPDGYLGGPKPHLRLKEIGCFACHNMNLTHFKVDKQKRDFLYLYEVSVSALKFLFNLLFNPVIVVK